MVHPFQFAGKAGIGVLGNHPSITLITLVTLHDISFCLRSKSVTGQDRKYGNLNFTGIPCGNT